MKHVVIVGAGASGLVSAIYAAKGGNKVTILERNTSSLKKLLITGNGKCNYFNEDMNLSHFHSSNNDLLQNIINDENIKEITSFFDKIGIVPKIKNGYYYPSSNMAVSFKNALLKEAMLLGVQIKNDAFVTDIIKKDKFIISTNKEKIEADVVILACGGMAAPKTGSDGSGYNLATNFNHTLIKPRPALVKLNGNETYFKDWDKIRCDAKISLYENDTLIKEEKGELQLTSSGISGVCVFNLSNYFNKGRKVLINFIPFINSKNIEDVLTFLEKRSNLVTGRNIEELLEGIINYKLVKIILKKSNIDSFKYYDELSKKEKYNLAKSLFSFEIYIKETGTFDEAQVTKGGIPLDEININTMESLKEKDLYITGEMLDVNGDCGGYNLTFAFISGMLAGRGVK